MCVPSLSLSLNNDIDVNALVGLIVEELACFITNCSIIGRRPSSCYSELHTYHKLYVGKDYPRH